jgi:divalent metal cation (Fe/Co/Zn/Cd) transporter
MVDGVVEAHTRADAVRRSKVLNRLTLGWNVVEGVVALAAGVAAGSVSLVGFGLDSAIEVSAALVIMWRLRQEHRHECMEPFDRRAVRIIAVSFFVLAAYVAAESVRELVAGADADVSTAGMVIAALSLVVMPALARAKTRLAPVIGSQAAVTEARQTMVCAYLSAVLLGGLGLNALFGWEWADPVAGLGIAVLAALEGREAWGAESLEDTCCGV